MDCVQVAHSHVIAMTIPCPAGLDVKYHKELTYDKTRRFNNDDKNPKPIVHEGYLQLQMVSEIPHKFWGMKRAIALHRAKRNGGVAVRKSPDSDSADDHAHGPAPDPAPRHYSCVFWEILVCLWGAPKKRRYFSSHTTIL